MAYGHVCILDVLYGMGQHWFAWFPIAFGIGSAIYLILIYIKHIIHLAIENDTIVILSRVMYENQQLKRRIVYLTNQMNQTLNDSNRIDSSLSRMDSSQ